jgi:hypothetical protein
MPPLLLLLLLLLLHVPSFQSTWASRAPLGEVSAPVQSSTEPATSSAEARAEEAAEEGVRWGQGRSWHGGYCTCGLEVGDIRRQERSGDGARGIVAAADNVHAVDETACCVCAAGDAGDGGSQ